MRVRIEAGVRPDGIAVPQRAVQLTPAGANVMVLGAGDVPQPRPVKLGAPRGGLWVITSGLKPGDKVIVDGLQKVSPGAGQAVRAGVKPAATPRPPLPAPKAPR